MKKNNNFYWLICFICISCLLITQPLSAYEKEIEGLSKDIAQHMERDGLETVAVADFTNLQGNITELGRFLAEEMSVELVITAENLKIIDRTHLNTILREHKLSMSGLIDPDTVKKLGQIAGVDAIVTGSVTPFGERVRVACKVIATDTARIVSATRRNIAQTSTIEELLARGIETGTQTAAPSQRPTRRAAPGEPIRSATTRDFVFEVQSAEISGDSVTVSLLITNEGDDRDLSLRGRGNRAHTRIFDNFGNQYREIRVQFANNTRTIGDQQHIIKRIGQRLVSGIPTELKLTVDSVPEEAEMIALVELDFDDFKVGLRNIPLGR